MKKIFELIDKYKELILYIVFGGLTTAVNFVAFWICGKLLGEDLYYVSNAIAWFVSVVFAYITNKLFVFEAKSFTPKVLFKEISVFFSARVFSFFVEEGGLVLLVWVLNFGEYSMNVLGFEINGQLIAKALLAVIVVLINYFVSKFAVFTKNTKE
ncbi:MAG: GtrA family protein [Clostridia bacterium]|nr:GtrA family protein [Clostridia bacterium]